MLNLLIKDYKQLNNVIKSIVDNNNIEWCEQMFLVDFYDRHSTSDKIEELRSLDPNSICILLNHVNSCAKNLNCECINKINLQSCFELELNQAEIAMKDIHANCKKIDEKVSKIKESIRKADAKGINTEEKQMYDRLYNYHIDERNRTNNQMHQLIDQTRKMKSSFEFYNKNIFNNLQKLNISYLHLLQGFI